MAYLHKDRTAEVISGGCKFTVLSTDYCRFHEKHPDTILWRKECWTCKYGDFGIDTGNPTEKGVCRYYKNPI